MSRATDPEPNSSDREIADCLARNRDRILSRWVESVKVKLPAGDRNSRPAIRDHIPQLLDRLSECLSELSLKEEARQKLKALAQEHGRQRSELPAYTIRQIVSEYRLLRKTLVQTIAESEKPDPTERTRRLIHEFIDECIEHAVNEFSDRNGDEHKKLQAQLESQVEELNQALRLRDEFISVASHELKTPLTALLLQLQLLERTARGQGVNPMSADSVARSVGRSVQQAARMRDMLDRLLDLSRIRSNRFSLDIATTDLQELVREVVARFEPAAQDQAGGLRFDPGPEAVYAYIDPLRIEQVVSNLVSNAIKYGDSKPITVTLEQIDSTARIVVRDEGIGIPASEHERIFNRFERATTAKQGESLGLGLYIAREIARAHGGDITVESQPGRGSRFTVTLPLKRVDLAGLGKDT